MSSRIKFHYSHFGVNDYDFWFHLRPLEETKLLFEYGSKMITDAGIHWDRVHLPGIFSWNVMEPVKGKYDWTIPDLLVRTAQKYNINLLPNIWPFAAWDQKAWEGKNRKKIDIASAMGSVYAVDDSCPIPPRFDGPHDLDAYSIWIKKMVDRYNGDGLNNMPGLEIPIKYWEFGNEVFAPLNWPTGDDKTFAEFTKISYLATKKGDPESKVILANANEVFNLPSKSKFYKEILELGKKEGAQYFDIINLHGSYSSDIFQHINDFKNLLSEYKTHAKIWVTEFASGKSEPPPFPVPEETLIEDNKLNFPIPKPFSQFAPPHEPIQQKLEGNSSSIISEKKQAINFFKALSLVFYNGVERVFFTGLGPIRPPVSKLNKPIPESFGSYSSFCMLDRKGKPRLVYYTALLFMSKLDGFKKIEKIDLGEDIEAFKYTIDKGISSESEILYVLWSDSEASATLDNLDVSFITVIGTVPPSDEKDNIVLAPGDDPRFRIQCLKVNKGQVTIKLSEEPVLIEP